MKKERSSKNLFISLLEIMESDFERACENTLSLPIKKCAGVKGSVSTISPLT